eukprot:COSAG01_NODE_16126_length_1268_cov_0.912746_1_plen_204_part_10
MTSSLLLPLNSVLLTLLLFLDPEAATVKTVHAKPGDCTGPDYARLSEAVALSASPRGQQNALGGGKCEACATPSTGASCGGWGLPADEGQGSRCLIDRSHVLPNCVHRYGVPNSCWRPAPDDSFCCGQYAECSGKWRRFGKCQCKYGEAGGKCKPPQKCSTGAWRPRCDWSKAQKMKNVPAHKCVGDKLYTCDLGTKYVKGGKC